jgi:hypothetical protein
LTTLLLAGIIAGACLGAADGALFHYIAGGFPSPQAAVLGGAALGMVGGMVVVLWRRALWGPEVTVEVGTVLGLLYGIAPGLAVLFQSIVVNGTVGVRSLAGLVMASSMAGLLIGGVFDRITELVLARVGKRGRRGAGGPSE